MTLADALPMTASDGAVPRVGRRRSSPDFELTPAVRPDVERICTRLDHLPLAIELAARRVNVLSPADILARLDDRFALLTGGGRRTPERQRTLEATLDWSFSLLSEPEQVMLTRLSVFAGGCTLEAAQAVCSGPPIAPAEVLDLLSALVDRSLRERGPRRGSVLATGSWRRCGPTPLITCRPRARLTSTRARHLAWYAEVSSAAVDRALWTLGVGTLDLKQLARESGNMRAAVPLGAATAATSTMGLRTANGVALYGVRDREPRASA